MGRPGRGPVMNADEIKAGLEKTLKSLEREPTRV